MVSRRAVFTIPPGLSFLDTLAAGLLERTRADPLELGRVLVLLPNRRAGRALTAAFLRATGGEPLLLPRVMPVGDLDEEALAFADAASPETIEPGGLDLPPAISPLRRQLLLSRLILKMRETTGQGPATADQAARLAAELGRLLDQVQTEQLPFERLATLVPQEFATHWQLTLTFLEVLTEAWPRILAAEGRLDPAERRNAVIAAQAELWRSQPPETPVIAAGSTGSIPATAALLGVVAGLPRGEVILPGLDLALDEASWEALEPTHAQYGMARLLDSLGMNRTEVAVWPPAAARPLPPAAVARQRLVSETMRPAATTDAWRRLDLDVPLALQGVTRVDCPGPEEEARVVALAMREALAEGRSAALVTPDRDLARRVVAEMRRWDVELDDSAGRPLGETPPVLFLRLLAAMAAQNCAPVALLAALKHPLAAGGEHPLAFRERVRRLELAALRGPRPAPGFAGLRRALERRGLAEPGRDALPEPDTEMLLAFVDRLAAMADDFLRLIHAPQAELPELLAAHVGFAERLATAQARDDENEEPRTIDGAARLWAHDEGEAAARFVSDLLDAGAGFGPIAGRDYPALLDSLLANAVVRPRFGTHPQLAIWGTIEARLLQVDHLILGGLNEGTWPPTPRPDQWMSRPMRQRFGLPAPERRIGLSAHDFAQALCAPRVTLTRAMRSEGAPTVPSRWLLRLDSVLSAARFAGEIGAPRQWLAWAEALDRPERIEPAPPPFPCPPVLRRPRALSAAEIETWLRDPYAIYARHVLRLEPLAPIDENPGVAERGAFVHAALDRFVQGCAAGVAEDALDRLLEIGREVFGPALDRPGVRAFWWPRFERIARWAVEQERQRRPSIRMSRTRVQGQLTLEAPAGPFTVRSRVDRIDLRTDGTIEIIEYKTGRIPRVQDVRSGAAPEMSIAAAVAAAAGFEGVPEAPVADLAYWTLSGIGDGGEIRGACGREAEAAALAAALREGLGAWVAAFDDVTTPYLAQPRPTLAGRRAAYAHLARVKEWSRSGRA